MARNPNPVARTKVSIGSVTADYTQVALAADTYVEIKGIRSVPATGDTFQEISVDEVGDARTRYAKGTAASPSMDIVCSRISKDPGQLAMIAAAGSLASYNFKIESPNPTGAATVEYLTCLVMSKTRGRGGPNDTQTQTFTLRAQEDPIVVEPT